MWSRFRARGQTLVYAGDCISIDRIARRIGVWCAGKPPCPYSVIHSDSITFRSGCWLASRQLSHPSSSRFIGVLADTRYRKRIMLFGGIVFTLSVLAIILSQTFLALMLSFIIIYPASGAFVSVAQATLMDTEPDRHDQNMARWTLAGSLGFCWWSPDVDLRAQCKYRLAMGPISR